MFYPVHLLFAVFLFAASIFGADDMGEIVDRYPLSLLFGDEVASYREIDPRRDQEIKLLFSAVSAGNEIGNLPHFDEILERGQAQKLIQELAASEPQLGDWREWVDIALEGDSPPDLRARFQTQIAMAPVLCYAMIREAKRGNAESFRTFWRAGINLMSSKVHVISVGRLIYLRVLHYLHKMEYLPIQDLREAVMFAAPVMRDWQKYDDAIIPTNELAKRELGLNEYHINTTAMRSLLVFEAAEAIIMDQGNYCERLRENLEHCLLRDDLIEYSLIDCGENNGGAFFTIHFAKPERMAFAFKDADIEEWYLPIETHP